MAELDLLQAINRTLHDEMERDPAIVLMGEDVCEGGAFRAADGLHDLFGAARVLDMPLSEGGAIGTAVGMALHGLRPVVELGAADWLWPGAGQLVDAARMRFRSAAQYTVPMVVRVPSGGGIGAGMDQSATPEAWLAGVPGLTVVCPADAADAAGLMRSALRAEDPVVFLEPARLYRAGRAEVDGETVEFGRARIRREGSDVTVLTWGGAVPTVEEAANRAADVGVQTEVVDLRTLLPLDIETVLASVARTGRVVIAADGPPTGGYGAGLAAELAERAILHLEAPILRVGGLDAPHAHAFDEQFLPDPERLFEAIVRSANF